MKFCKYCGAQLEDNAVCTCEKSKAAAAQQQYVQPNPQPQQYQPQQPSPYAVNAAPATGDNPFVKALKNVPVVFTSFWKNSKAVIETAKNDGDVIIAGIYTAIFFVAMLLNSMFFMISLRGLSFGKTLLVALVMTILVGGFYSLILFAHIKKNSDLPVSKAFINAFITFAINSIPASITLILGGLCALFSGVLCIIFFALTVSYIIITLVFGIKDAMGQNVKNPAVTTILVTVCITAALLIIAYVGVYMTIWSYDIETAFGSFSSLSSILSLFS